MAIDWTRIVKKYKGQWVALKDDQRTVIAHSDTLKSVLEKAEKKGFPNPLVTQMPDPNVSFVGQWL